ncbi:MAG: hypothetical protein COB84_08520 [Rhodobacteraceae bacterium]|nr:MAG: hypothetical protein COB84_08520 [Paracoccaceae bacterium]
MNMLQKLVRRFKADEGGFITLELCLMMPLMVTWIVGSYAFFDGFKTYLTSSKATYTAVDLVARQTIVDDDYIGVVGTIFESIVYADGGTAKIVISSVEQSGDDLVLKWSTGTNGAAALSSAAQIPVEFIPIMTDGETVIVIQSFVPFIPRYSWGKLISKTFENTLAVTPRFTAKITNSDQL